MTYYSAPTEPYPQRRSRTSGAMVAADIVALIGAVVAGVSIFMHGWVNAKVTFISNGPSGVQILQQFGLDIDRELMRIANNEVNSTIAPTMWQYKGHAFQLVFALIVLAAILLIVGLVAPRLRVASHAVAVAAGIGAAVIMVVTLLRIQDRMNSAPARITQAILSNPLVGRAFSVTTGKPHLDSGPGWPLYAAGAGIALTVLGALVGLIIAATRRPERGGYGS